MTEPLPPVWVVSLRRSVERRAHITRELNALGITFEFYDAVDGAALSAQDAALCDSRKGLQVLGRVLTPGEVGCSLSHVHLWQKQIDSGHRMIVVLEDDAVVGEAFADVVEAVRRLPNDWDILHLNRGDGAFPSVISTWGQSRLGVAHSRVRPTTPIDGTYGYVLHESGAAKLLKHVFPIRFPADALTGGTFPCGLRIYGVSPQVVGYKELGSTMPEAYELRAAICAEMALAQSKRRGTVRAAIFLRERIQRCYQRYSPFAHLKLVK